VGDTLIGQLQNDIQVIAEIKKWCNEDHPSYSTTIAEYLEFLHRLQTVTSSILPKKLIRKMESVMSSETKVVDGTETKSTASTKTVVVESVVPSPATDEPIIQDLPQKEDSPINDETIFEMEDSSDYPDEVPGEPGDDELNYRDLMEYLNEKLKNDLSGKEKLMNAKSIIYTFCKLEEFPKRFEQLRAMIDSGTVKWPGGFAVGEMTKMLNPEYMPNIR
jgi:hypothetical protein